MAWVQLFPTNATPINQSVNQIQQNWLFIQNNINTDHFFNSGAPTEGHHRFVHLPAQVADPIVALAGVIYAKNNASGHPRLYYNAPEGVSQIPTSQIFPNILLPNAPPATDIAVVNFAGGNPFYGIVWVHDIADNNNYAVAAINFIGGMGASARVAQIAVAGRITRINDAGGANTVIQLRKSAAPMNVEVVVLKTET
jgi:hypothetical protein